MSNNGNDLNEISDVISPVASHVLIAAAGGAAVGIKESTGDIWGALVGDPLKIWRTRRLMDGLEDVARKLKDKGIDLNKAKALPFGDMLVLFDGISKEEDKTLSDLWAGLIAESMIEKTDPSISARSVAAVLSQLSPESARIFELLAKESKASLIRGKLIKIKNKNLAPLGEVESKWDEQGLQKELRRIETEISEFWEIIHNSSSEIIAHLEIAKGELLRLNLVVSQGFRFSYFDHPSNRNYELNKSGIDEVLEDIQQNMRQFVESRTNLEQLPLIVWGGDIKTNFELSMSGKEIAKKLGLL